MKWAVVSLACVVFVAAGSLMIYAGIQQGWLVVIFFGLGILVSIVPLFTGRLNLLLTADAFTVGALWGSRTIRWTDVNSFEAQSLGRTELVRFETMSNSGQKTGYLSETYGMSANNLAELINTWRRRYSG